MAAEAAFLGLPVLPLRVDRKPDLLPFGLFFRCDRFAPRGFIILRSVGRFRGLQR
jgi:hypothetical protein